MQHTVDEVMLVPDDEMLAWMRHLHTDAGLVIEPAGAAGITAIAKSRGHHKFARVGAILTGGNLTQKQMEELAQRLQMLEGTLQRLNQTVMQVGVSVPNTSAPTPPKPGYSTPT